MKLLVTGGTTFGSRYTAEHFSKRGDDVFVLNRNSRPQVEGVTLIERDRNDLGDVLRGEHFDAVLDITAYTEEHAANLLNSGVTFDDYILVSSSAVYPETNVQPFTEEQPCGRNSIWGDYGTNKLKAEQVVQKHAPNAYILRPPYFYGVYENLYREAFPFDCAAQSRKFYIPGDGSMKLQFFNVKDLCRFIEILLEKHPQNKIYNLGSEPVTVKEWVTLCYRIAGKEPEFESVVGDIEQRNYFCFYNYEYVLDITKQKELMSETCPLEDGLKEEYEWYKKNPESVYYRRDYMGFIDSELKKG